MLLFIVILSPVIELVPIGTLTGVLFMVVINTFNWSTFMTLRKVSLADAFVIVEVTVLAVVFNLAVGVIVGVATISICDAWDRGGAFRFEIKDVRANPLAESKVCVVAVVHLGRWGNCFHGTYRSIVGHILF